MTEAEQCIRQALQEVKVLIECKFAEVGGLPVPGSALDQAGLQDGALIVENFLEHNEAGIALDHLIYMTVEAELPISIVTFCLIEQAGRAFEIDSKLMEQIRAVCVNRLNSR